MEERQNRFGRGVAVGIVSTLVAVIILVAGVVAALGLTGWQGFRGNGGEDGYGIDDAETLQKLDLLQQYIDEYFLYDVDKDVVADSMYHGLVNGLNDPYADYYAEEEYAEMKEQSSGEYYGIGVTVNQNTITGVITIIQVFSSGPAKEAGLMPDDVLQAVNDVPIASVDLEEVVTMIRGAEGSTVKVTVYRPSVDEYLDFDVERRRVQEDTVSHEMLENQIGYLKLTAFELVSPNQFAAALKDLRVQGMKALVLDLRNNGGGDLTSVVDIGNQVLPKGTILTIDYSDGTREVYESEGKSPMDVPMVVLVNGNTASAAEVLSGAAKDHGIATLVGTQTFGKGIVQTLFPLGDGTAIKLTVADYYTPSGANIHGVGIKPDVIVELDDSGEDNQLAKALEILKKEIK